MSAKLQVKKSKKSNLKFKKGNLLWWKRIGASSSQDINCPCIVTSVSRSGFSVFSFDDGFIAGPISFDSSTAMDEFVGTDKRKVQKYIKVNVKRLSAEEDLLAERLEGIKTSIAMLEDASKEYL